MLKITLLITLLLKCRLVMLLLSTVIWLMCLWETMQRLTWHQRSCRASLWVMKLIKITWTWTIWQYSWRISIAEVWSFITKSAELWNLVNLFLSANMNCAVMKGKDLATAVTEFDTAVHNYFKENFFNCEKLYRSGLVNWTSQSHDQKPY